MCLVDRDQTRVALFEQVAEAVGVDPLGRDVEQFDRAVENQALDPVGLDWREGAVQILRVGAGALQRGDLIVHEGDQGRDDHGQAVRADRGELIAERLAAAGGHQDKGVAAVQDVLDRLTLLWTKRVVAVGALQRTEQRIGLTHGNRSPRPSR